MRTIYIIILLAAFSCVINGYAQPTGELAKAQKELRPYLELLSNSSSDLNFGLDCTTDNYDFIDSICSVIYNSAHNGVISPFSLEMIKKGYLEMHVWTYNSKQQRYNLPYWGDLYQEFDRYGDYIIEIEFSFTDDIYYTFNFNYSGLRFSSMVFLYPFYSKIIDSRIQHSLIMRPLLYFLCPEAFNSTFKGYFFISKGKLMKSEIKRSLWNGIYEDRESLNEFLIKLNFDIKEP